MNQLNIDATIEIATAPSGPTEINLRQMVMQVSNGILDDVDVAMYNGDQDLDEAEAILSLHRIRGRVQALQIALGSLM